MVLARDCPELGSEADDSVVALLLIGEPYSAEDESCSVLRRLRTYAEPQPSPSMAANSEPKSTPSFAAPRWLSSVKARMAMKMDMVKPMPASRPTRQTP